MKPIEEFLNRVTQHTLQCPLCKQHPGVIRENEERAWFREDDGAVCSLVIAKWRVACCTAGCVFGKSMSTASPELAVADWNAYVKMADDASKKNAIENQQGGQQ